MSKKNNYEGSIIQLTDPLSFNTDSYDPKIQESILAQSFKSPRDLENLAYILKDIMQGDNDLRKRDEYSYLNFDQIKVAIDWILNNDIFEDSLKSSLLQDPWRLNFKEKPPTPEEFLTEKYIGPTAENLYFPLRKAFIEFFDPLKPYRTALLCPSIGAGKEQPLDVDIRMADESIKKMGDIEVGDEVKTPYGSSKVTHVHPQGVKPCYLITLSDGRKTRCGLDHLWRVCYRKAENSEKIWENVTTKFILENMNKFKFEIFNLDYSPIIFNSIEYIGDTEQQCITLEDERGLYYTDEDIITHNSTLTVLINIYIATYFALMWNPHKYFSLSPTTIFVGVFCATSQKKGSEILMEPLISLLETTPFFQKVRTAGEMKAEEKRLQDSSSVEYIPWTTSTASSVMQTGNGLQWKLVAQANSLLGMNILVGSMTELGFFIEAGWSEVKVEQFFTKLKQRISSRFKNNYLGRFVLDSSPSVADEFPGTYIWGPGRENRENYFWTGGRWNLYPEEFPEFCKVTNLHTIEQKIEEVHNFDVGFKLFKGGNGKLPVVLETEAEAAMYDEIDCIWCPRKQIAKQGTSSFLDKANENPIEFMRDFAGIPSGSADRIFYQPEMITNCFTNGLKNIYGAIAAPAMENPEHLIWDQVYSKFFYKIMDKFSYYYEPGVARCVSVDQSKSKDVTCISVSHAARDATRVDPITGQALTVYVTDFTIYIVPKGGLINLDAIKFFICDLRNLGNLNIKHVSFDGYESEVTKQFLRRAGFDVHYVSVDKNNDAYMTYIDLVFKNRWYCGKNAFMKNNMKSLQMSKRKATATSSGSSKVDHTKGDLIYDWKGDWDLDLCGINAKDGTDAVSGNIWLMGVYSTDFPPVTVFDPKQNIDRDKDSIMKKNLEFRKRMGLN